MLCNVYLMHGVRLVANLSLILYLCLFPNPLQYILVGVQCPTPWVYIDFVICFGQVMQWKWWCASSKPRPLKTLCLFTECSITVQYSLCLRAWENLRDVEIGPWWHFFRAYGVLSLRTTCTFPHMLASCSEVTWLTYHYSWKRLWWPNLFQHPHFTDEEIDGEHS